MAGVLTTTSFTPVLFSLVVPLTPTNAPPQLLAPTRQLETYRIRECYLPGPYLVPRDSGYLHYATEHLRSALGKELGIEAAVEGFQVREKYLLRVVKQGMSSTSCKRTAKRGFVTYATTSTGFNNGI